MNNDLWEWLNSIAALVLIASLAVRRYQVTALGMATGIMGAWSFLNLLWGLSVPHNPVSLVGPILGGGVTTVAYLLCLSWAGNTEPAPRVTELIIRVPRWWPR
jgi:hypothetical protein